MAPAPAIGLVLLRAEWFDSVVALPELALAVREDAQAIAAFLGKFLDVRYQWEISSSESLQTAVEAVRSAQVDLFVLAFQVWAEDFYLSPLVRAIGERPVAVWCFLPWSSPPRPLSFSGVLRASGPVGTLEGLGTLKNLGKKYFFTQGAPGDPRLQADLLAFAQAGQLRRGLLSARFGLLPGRNEQMQSTFVDEFRLLAEIGPAVLPLSVAELADCAAGLPQAAVEDFLTHLRLNYSVQGVDEDTLRQAARASLGLAQLAADRKVDVISLNDISPELHERLGLRPCLYPPLYDQAGIVAGLEGDLGAATALFILKRLAGDPLFFVEFWYWDEKENLIVGGHAGVQNPGVALPGKVMITHDYEFAQSDRTRGAHYQFIARPGRVTLLQIRCTPSGWQAVCLKGEAIASEPWLEGYPHAVIRLDAPLDAVLRRLAQVGTTQHFAMAYGDASMPVACLCDLLGVPLELM